MAKKPIEPNDPSLAGAAYPDIDDASWNWLLGVYKRMDDSTDSAMLEGLDAGLELIQRREQANARNTSMSEQREQLKEKLTEELGGADDPPLFQG